MKKIFLTLGLCLSITTISINAEEVILGGDSIGIEVEYDGVMISGFYEIEGLDQNQLQIGDLIVAVDGKKVTDIHGFISLLQEGQSEYEIQVLRHHELLNTTLKTTMVDGQIKTGLFLKEKLIGIGTLTYIDDGKYGALGHEITDTETNQMINTQKGTIYQSMVTSIRKAQPYKSGEKNATILFDQPLGTVTQTNHLGVYGQFFKNASKQRIETASYEEVELGIATFYTVLNRNRIEPVQIQIMKINPNQEQKQLEFEVIDEQCLAISNGIVQGMSGSPIVQNGRLIGAVTHVSSQDAKIGYGILIDEMLHIDKAS